MFVHLLPIRFYNLLQRQRKIVIIFIFSDQKKEKQTPMLAFSSGSWIMWLAPRLPTRVLPELMGLFHSGLKIQKLACCNLHCDQRIVGHEGQTIYMAHISHTLQPKNTPFEGGEGSQGQMSLENATWRSHPLGFVMHVNIVKAPTDPANETPAALCLTGCHHK